jgi:DNA-binding response OmpR family regulator
METTKPTQNRIAGESSRASTIPNPSRRILVVEDDLWTRQFSAKALIHAGYEADAAEDGADAWEMLNAARYDLLITDNTMPRVTGVELLRMLHSARIALPVIMATGSLPAHEFEQSPWLTPTATLLKPFVLADLLATVRAVLCVNESNAGRTAHSRCSRRPQSELNRRYLRAGTNRTPSLIAPEFSART